MACNGCVSVQQSRGHADTLSLLTHRHSLEPTPSKNKTVRNPNGVETLKSLKGVETSKGPEGRRVCVPHAVPLLSPIDPPVRMVLKKEAPLLPVLRSSCDALCDYKWQLIGLMMSFFICVACNVVEISFVDPSFFKAIGLLLAVMLSLRAKNALGRRQAMMAALMRMMNSAWSILCLVDPEDCNPQRLAKYLAFCFQEVAFYIDDVNDSKDVQNPMKIEDLDEADRDMTFIMCQKGYYHESPRPLLLHVRQVCDQIFEPDKHLELSGGDMRVDKIRIIRRFHCNIDRELNTIITEFDHLRMFKEPYLTVQYVSMIHAVIFIYMALYPWCVAHENTQILGVTAIGMGIAFYGLNHVTVGLESPMTQRGQGFNLFLTFHQMFGQLGYQAKVREKCKQLLETSREGKTFEEMRAEMDSYVATLHHSDSETTSDDDI